MMCASPDFTRPGEGELERELAAYRRVLRRCSILGVRYCRILSGQRRPQMTREGIDRTVRAISNALETTRELDLVLVLENHFKDGFWDYPEFAQDPLIYLEILEALPTDPHFGVNFDPSNALTAGWDPLDLLDAVIDRVVTMHASDRQWIERNGRRELQHGIIGEGAIDYDGVFSRLARAGFRGWISIEDGNDPVIGIECLQRSATYLRSQMKRHQLP